MSDEESRRLHPTSPISYELPKRCPCGAFLVDDDEESWPYCPNGCR